MESTVKGIRYSYQINYLNTEPTHLKSQVHNLPVVSEPQQTPLDIQKNQDAYIPSNEARMTYAAPTAGMSAAPAVNLNTSSATTVPTGRNVMSTGGIGNAGLLNTVAPTDTNPLLTETNISEPQQIARATQAESAVSRPASNVAAQSGLNGNLGNALHPTAQFVGLDKIASDIPASDASPIESVKANPRLDFQRTERTFIPNQNSFFQNNGLESVVTDGDELEANAASNNAATARVSEIDNIENAQTVEKPIPSYMIPGPDEVPEEDAGNSFFNRYLGQQAKTLYGFISGAVAQSNYGNLNLIG